MYRYIDRRLGELSQIEQMLVRCMRDWAVARQLYRCPVDAVILRFLSHRLVGAVEPFHLFLTLVSQHGCQRIQLACPCASTVSEGEAILLALMLRGPRSLHGGTTDISALIHLQHRPAAIAALNEFTAALMIAGAE